MTWDGSRLSRLPAGWPKLRNHVLKRDGRICHLCGGPGADGVDHVVAGDDHSEQNLKAVHHRVEPRCHAKKSAQEGVAARKKITDKHPREAHPGLLD